MTAIAIEPTISPTPTPQFSENMLKIDSMVIPTINIIAIIIPNIIKKLTKDCPRS